jgi:hypothetical protein
MTASDPLTTGDHDIEAWRDMFQDLGMGRLNADRVLQVAINRKLMSALAPRPTADTVDAADLEDIRERWRLEGDEIAEVRADGDEPTTDRLIWHSDVGKLLSAIRDATSGLDVAPHPDANHEFRNVCRLCGETGYLHVAFFTWNERVSIRAAESPTPEPDGEAGS